MAGAQKVALSPTTKALLEARDEGGSQAELNRISQRLLELESEIRVVKVHYNSKLPIGRLPSEVLCEIFVYVVLVETLDRETLSRFIMGQVCQRWRIVALDCSELWEEISLDEDSSDMIEAMIARSKKARIAVQKGPETDWFSIGFMRKVFVEVDRLRALRLACGAKNHHSLPQVLANFPPIAPALEELHLQCDHEDIESAPILPPGFLNGGAHSLKRLFLCVPKGIPLSAITFSTQLTHLQLFCPPTHHTNRESLRRPSLCSFFLFITSMPALQEFTLSGYLPHGGEQNQIVRYKPLRALRRLVMCDYIHHLCNVLPFLRLSNCTEPELVVHENVTHENISRLLHSSRSLQGEDGLGWIGEGDLEVHRLRVVMEDFKLEDTGVLKIPKIQFWFHKEGEPSSPPRLALGFVSDEVVEAMVLIAVEALTMGRARHNWDLSPTTSVELCGNPGHIPRTHFLLDIFGIHLPNLRTIIFKDCALFFYQFLSILEASAHRSNSEPPFPALASVECLDVDFFHNLHTVTDTLSAFQARAKKSSRPILELRCTRSSPLDWPNLKDFPQLIPETRIVCDGYATYEAFLEDCRPRWCKL